MDLPFVNKIVCHFGATYTDCMIGDLPFLFWNFKGDVTMIANAKFNEVLTVWYFLNGLKVIQ